MNHNETDKNKQISELKEKLSNALGDADKLGFKFVAIRICEAIEAIENEPD